MAVNRLILLLLSASLIFSCQSTRKEKRVLIFTKALNSVHGSLPKSISAISALCMENGIFSDTTTNSEYFHEDSLKGYSAIIFLNATGDVLNYRQQADFKRYIQSGGGYVGIHAAATAEYQWPWYNQLVGAYFNGHPEIQEATVIKKAIHESINFLPEKWIRTDEWYNYRNIQEEINVLLELDESSYEGGEHGDFHPITWYRDFDGGRSWYTGLGHTTESYDEDLFLQHVLGGIQYAIGENKINDYTTVTAERVPADENFVKHVLAEKLDEPMELTVLPEGKILFVERRGDIHLYDPDSESLSLAGRLEVYDGYEDGMLGLTHDPNFSINNWIYIYYSPAGPDSIQRLSRFEFNDDQVKISSESIILEIPSQRKECCHSAGSLAFDANGLLYLSLGDNTNPLTYSHYDRDHIFAPHDERPGKEPWDAQRTSGNTNDLRGGIIRIKPGDDGSYTIPPGNLFPDDEPNTRPEIYVMGGRNPFRISIDKKTGYLYFGEVGTDTGADSERGPRGYDEYNQVREAGFFGWPYVVANNIPYARYMDHRRVGLGELFDPMGAENRSINNTGKNILPPAQPAMIWYPYEVSEEFPSLGKGGRNAMAGPVYYSEDYPDNNRRFPSYYDGKWFIYEWMRNWIKVVTFDESGDLLEMEPFLPGLDLASPMDMEFGYDGAMYFIEYGTNWFTGNDDARLVRIDYNDKNRLPVTDLYISKTRGAVPMEIELSADGSFDYDKEDDLSFEWISNGEVISTQSNTTLKIDNPGTYTIEITVTDSKGESTTKSTTVIAGNEPPQIQMVFEGNQSFYQKGESISYEVLVNDLEDGTINDSGFPVDSLEVRLAYLEGIKPQDAEIVSLNPNREGMLLIEGSDCKACHSIDQTSVGPSYRDVANRYADQEEAQQNLAEKIIKGGGGNWGDHSMAAHPQFSLDEARAIVRYILSINEAPIPFEAKGSLPSEEEQGLYIFEVSYTDQGAGDIPPISVSNRFVLRPALVQLEDCDDYTYLVKSRPSSTNYMQVSTTQNPATMTFKGMDLAGFQRARIRVSSIYDGNLLEIRSGSIEGALIAQAPIPNTGDPLNWQNIEIQIESETGQKDIVFIMRNPDSGLQQDLFNMDWIEFLP